jgi:hypothetical protein
MIERGPNMSCFMEFVNKFMYSVVYFIDKKVLDRRPMVVKYYLQVVSQVRMGDWFLDEYFITIEIYGLDLIPFRLLLLFTPNMFMLEFVRYLSYIYDMYFKVSKRKGIYLT